MISFGTIPAIDFLNIVFVCVPETLPRGATRLMTSTTSSSSKGTRASIECAMLILSMYVSRAGRYILRSTYIAWWSQCESPTMSRWAPMIADGFDPFTAAAKSPE